MLWHFWWLNFFVNVIKRKLILDSNIKNTIPTIKQANSENKNSVTLLTQESSSLFEESDSEDVQSDWDVDVKNNPIRKCIFSDSETEDNVEEDKNFNNAGKLLTIG